MNAITIWISFFFSRFGLASNEKRISTWNTLKRSWPSSVKTKSRKQNAMRKFVSVRIRNRNRMLREEKYCSHRIEIDDYAESRKKNSRKMRHGEYCFFAVCVFWSLFGFVLNFMNKFHFKMPTNSTMLKRRNIEAKRNKIHTHTHKHKHKTTQNDNDKNVSLASAIIRQRFNFVSCVIAQRLLLNHLAVNGKRENKRKKNNEENENETRKIENVQDIELQFASAMAATAARSNNIVFIVSMLSASITSQNDLPSPQQQRQQSR